MYGYYGVKWKGKLYNPSQSWNMRITVTCFLHHTPTREQNNGHFPEIISLHWRKLRRSYIWLLRGFSPQANYADRATATCRRTTTLVSVKNSRGWCIGTIAVSWWVSFLQKKRKLRFLTVLFI
jgi:hypothetical protein